jgi:hypothetical protein
MRIPGIRIGAKRAQCSQERQPLRVQARAHPRSTIARRVVAPVARTMAPAVTAPPRIATALLSLLLMRGARAQEAPAASPVEVERLEAAYRESIAVRRGLAWVVLVNGLAQLAVGGALLIQSGADGAYRSAGVHTLVFAVFNVPVGAYALHGIARTERGWEAPEARTARRSEAGLRQAATTALLDERREAVAHGINLGLDCMYAAMGVVEIVAAHQGVDHADAWQAGGIAMITNAAVLVAVDAIGLARSARFNLAFLHALAPDVSLARSGDRSVTLRFGLSARF